MHYLIPRDHVKIVNKEQRSTERRSMPALVLCRRRWEVGSDDFVFPGFAAVGLRSLVLLATIISLVAYKDKLSCPDLTHLVYLSFVMVFVNLVVIALEIAIAACSARGTITNSKPRWAVPYLLYTRIGLFVLEGILGVIGVVFAFKDQLTSDNSVQACANLSGIVTAIKVFMVWFICLLFVIVLGSVIYLDPCHCYRPRMLFNPQPSDKLILKRQVTLDGQEMWQRQKQENRTVWERRFRMILCSLNLSNDHHRAYYELAAIFSNVLCDINVVPSDIVAGLVLLQRHQLAEEVDRQGAQEQGSLGEDTPLINSRFSDATHYSQDRLDFTKDEEATVFKNALYYFKYAVAAYAWRGDVYMGEPCAGCRLCAQVLQGGCCWQDQRDFILADNKCHCGFYGLRNLSGLVNAEIVYCTFENNLYQVPFYVVVDHEEEAVVVAMRGTISVYDMVTDLISYTEPIQIPGSVSGQHYAHKGMYHSAMWVKETLCAECEGRSILNRAFEKGRGYKLVLTGHSLGGGCSALLSVLLKEQYPDLRCYAYGVPGAVLDINGAMYTKSFITSITVGKDLVARLSICTCCILKQDIMTVLETYNKPKYRILLEGALETLSHCCGRRHIFRTMQLNVRLDESPSAESPVRASLEPEDIEEEEDALVQQEEVEIHISEATESGDSNQPLRSRESTCSPVGDQSTQDLLAATGDSTTPSSPEFRVPLYPPGYVIHIREVPTRRSIFADKEYEAIRVNNDRFQRIIICPSMLKDHFPHTIKKAMESVWNASHTAVHRNYSNSPTTLL